MQLEFDLMNARHITGKKDPSKTYTVVEGIVTLPNGMRGFCEAFLMERKLFQPGPHMLSLEVQIDRDRRIIARVENVVPVAARAPAPAPARVA